MIQFEVGKTYSSLHNQKYTVTKRSNSFITFVTTWGNGKVETIRKKILAEIDNLYHKYSTEYVKLDNHRNCIRACWLDQSQQNTAPAETAKPETDSAPQNDSKKLPRLVTFYVNGYYLLPLEPEYMHYVHVIERSENTITVEDFVNGNIHTLDISIQDGNYARCEYVKRPEGKGRAHDGYADKELLGFTRSEHPRHPVFEIGKSYSATREISGEIYTLTFTVEKRVKLKHGKNDKYQNVIVAGKMSGHPIEHPVDFAVRLYWDKPSDPEYFSQDGFIFNAENPDETTAPVQEDSQPEHDDSNSDAPAHVDSVIPKLRSVSKAVIMAVIRNENEPSSYFRDWDAEKAVRDMLKFNHNIIISCDNPDLLPAILNTASKITLAYMRWHDFPDSSRNFVRDCCVNQTKETLISNYLRSRIELGTNRLIPVQEILRKRLGIIPPAQKSQPTTDLPAPVHECFTIVPSEHIERPEYTSYPDTIPDDIPYTVIPAIDAPQPPAVTTLKPAGLQRVNAAVVSTWIHFVAFFLKLWFASRFQLIPSEYRAQVYNAIQPPHKPKNNRLLFAFSVGKVYPAWVNLKKQYLVVTDRWIDKNGFTHVTFRDEDNTSYCFTPCLNEHGDEFVYFKRWDEFCFSWQDVMQTQSPEYKFAQSFARAKDHDARLKILKKLPLSALVQLAEREKIPLLNKHVQWQCVCDILTDIETRFAALDTNELPHELFTPITAAKREWDFEQADLLASNSRKRKLKTQNLNAPFIDTRNLSGHDLHEATAKNVRATLNAYTQGTLASELRKLSVSAIKRIGKCLGLLHQREKGNAHSLAVTLSARLFEHRTEPEKNSSAQQRQAPKTYTDCNRQIVIIFDC